MIRKVVALAAVLVGVALAGSLGPLSVAAQASPSADRSFSPDPVSAGGQVTVTITVDGYGSFASVVETLPAGFTYGSTTGLPADQVSTSGQEITFNLLGQSAPHTFRYTVTASTEAGDHTFSGEFSGVDSGFTAFSDVDVEGDSTITLRQWQPTRLRPADLCLPIPWVPEKR